MVQIFALCGDCPTAPTASETDMNLTQAIHAAVEEFSEGTQSLRMDVKAALRGIIEKHVVRTQGARAPDVMTIDVVGEKRFTNDVWCHGVVINRVPKDDFLRLLLDARDLLLADRMAREKPEFKLIGVDRTKGPDRSVEVHVPTIAESAERISIAICNAEIAKLQREAFVPEDKRLHGQKIDLAEGDPTPPGCRISG